MLAWLGIAEKGWLVYQAVKVVHALDVGEEAAAVLFIALDVGWGEPVLDPFVVRDDGRMVWYGND